LANLIEEAAVIMGRAYHVVQPPSTTKLAPVI
jgi:hypothetical protein